MERERAQNTLYLDRKVFCVSMETLGNTRGIKLEERKRRGFSSWLHLSVDSSFWLLDAMQEAMENQYSRRRWPRREGESCFLCEVKENEADKYLRISRMRRGDEARSYAICVPCGDGNYYWSVLCKEIIRVLKVNKEVRRITQSVPDRSAFQSTLSVTSSANKVCKGKIWVAGFVRWQRVVREVLQQLKWDSFIDFEIVDEQTATVVLTKRYWLDIWRPKKIIVDDSVVTISQGVGDSVIATLERGNQKTSSEQVIPIKAMSMKEKWLKIRGIPHRYWSYSLFDSFGYSLGGFMEIASSSLKKENLNLFRISVHGELTQIPAILMVEEGDQKWAASIEWDCKFQPKNKASLEEYNRLVTEFDKKNRKFCFQIQNHPIYMELNLIGLLI